MTESPRQPFGICKKHGLFVAQWLLIGAGLAALLSFAGLQPPTSTTGTADGGKDLWRSHERRASSDSLFGNYLSGRFAANNGDFPNANYYLSRTLRYDPSNTEIAGYGYRMQLMTGDMEAAVKSAKRLYDQKDTLSNPEIMMLLSHVRAGEWVQAREVLKTFEPTGFNIVMIPLMAAWIEQAEGKLTQPLRLDALLRHAREFTPFIQYQCALVNDLAGFKDVAMSQYEEALASTHSMPFRVVQMLGNLYERSGQQQKAQALYDKFHEVNPESLLDVESWSNDMGHEFVKQTPEVATSEEAQKTGKPSRLLKTIQDGVAEIFFSTASILGSENLSEEALIYVQQVLYLKPDFEAATVMRGNLLERLGHFEEALQAYDQLPSVSPYFVKAAIRKAYVLNRLGRSKEGLKMLRTLRADEADRYQIDLSIGDILMRDKAFDDAYKAYSQALELIKQQTEIHWPILYARGISAERSGQWEKAEADFLNALKLEPEQPDVLNYLGYSWLLQGKNVQEAKSMVSRAAALRPSDAHIIDSLGWAHYLSGEYADAVDALERAIEIMPTDPTVNDHLGDVYWQLGRKHEARFQWQRALLFKPEPEQESQLHEKLKSGLPPLQHALKTADGAGVAASSPKAPQAQ